MTQIKSAMNSLLGKDKSSSNNGQSLDNSHGDRLSNNKSDNLTRHENEPRRSAASSGTNQSSKTSSTTNNNNVQRGARDESNTHVGEVTNTTKHSHSVEEVQRQRDIERNEKHIQVVHQPVNSESHSAEQLHKKTLPTQELRTTHQSTDKDAALLNSVASPESKSTRLMPNESKVVDKGERVNETVHTHTQNVVVPIIDEHVHEHHRIKTTAPTHQVIDEAPIIHQAKVMPAMNKEDFLSGGGVLGSKTKLNDGTFLSNGQ
jgi:hypothetical protein